MRGGSWTTLPTQPAHVVPPCSTVRSRLLTSGFCTCGCPGGSVHTRTTLSAVPRIGSDAAVLTMKTCDSPCVSVAVAPSTMSSRSPGLTPLTGSSAKRT